MWLPTYFCTDAERRVPTTVEHLFDSALPLLGTAEGIHVDRPHFLRYF